mmetsp:Transcript_20198/g.42207  ORF Transcript_20198/g.42207 Transcript_20198/m.42207 type:complete len:239 (-) Transcript_20198:42-758(-)
MVWAHHQRCSASFQLDDGIDLVLLRRVHDLHDFATGRLHPSSLVEHAGGGKDWTVAGEDLEVGVRVEATRLRGAHMDPRFQGVDGGSVAVAGGSHPRHFLLQPMHDGLQVSKFNTNRILVESVSFQQLLFQKFEFLGANLLQVMDVLVQLCFHPLRFEGFSLKLFFILLQLNCLLLQHLFPFLKVSHALRQDVFLLLHFKGVFFKLLFALLQLRRLAVQDTFLFLNVPQTLSQLVLLL